MWAFGYMNTAKLTEQEQEQARTQALVTLFSQEGFSPTEYDTNPTFMSTAKKRVDKRKEVFGRIIQFVDGIVPITNASAAEFRNLMRSGTPRQNPLMNAYTHMFRLYQTVDNLGSKAMKATKIVEMRRRFKTAIQKFMGKGLYPDDITNFDIDNEKQISAWIDRYVDEAPKLKRMMGSIRTSTYFQLGQNQRLGLRRKVSKEKQNGEFTAQLQKQFTSQVYKSSYDGELIRLVEDRMRLVHNYMALLQIMKTHGNYPEMNTQKEEKYFKAQLASLTRILEKLLKQQNNAAKQNKAAAVKPPPKSPPKPPPKSPPKPSASQQQSVIKHMQHLAISSANSRQNNSSRQGPPGLARKGNSRPPPQQAPVNSQVTMQTRSQPPSRIFGRALADATGRRG